MSEERDDEQAVRDQTAEMGHTADEMEQRIDDLGGDIEDAKKTAQQRQDAPDEPVGEVAGDWEGEAAGADQGDDATDSGSTDDA